MTPFTIAAARSDELDLVIELLHRAKLPTDDLHRHVDTLLVARRGATIIGSAALEVYGAGALLRSVAVDESARGQGLGRRLTQAALDLARARHVKTVYLLTTTAGAFFPRFGFTTVQRDDVDPAVRKSVEFTTACPAGAQVMARQI